MKKKNCFTLAEVLITLGIIGVVAALTIPSLIANTNSAKFKSQYKKSLSTLGQAVRMNEAQYGFNLAETTTACGYFLPSSYSTATNDCLDDPKTIISTGAIFAGNLAGLTFVKDVNSFSEPKLTLNSTTPLVKGDGYWTFKMADGSDFAFNSGTGFCTLALGSKVSAINPSCIGFIDVNGVGTPPNKEVSCTNPSKNGIVGSSTDCIVNNQSLGDVFPIAFHDGVVEPASNAAKYVLTSMR